MLIERSPLLYIGGLTIKQHCGRSRLQLPILLAGVTLCLGSMLETGDLHRMPLLTIYSGTQPPTGAFAAVRYGRSSFWVDDRDLNSKRVFMFLRMFSSLAETGVVPAVQRSSPSPLADACFGGRPEFGAGAVGQIIGVFATRDPLQRNATGVFFGQVLARHLDPNGKLGHDFLDGAREQDDLICVWPIRS